MNERPARWASLGGLAFALLLVVALLIQADPHSTSDAEWTRFVGDRGNRIAVLIAMYLKVAGGLCLFAFLLRLHSVLARTEGGQAPTAGVAFTAGLVFLVLYLTSAAAMGAFAATPMRLGEYDLYSLDVIRFSFQLGYVLLLVPGMFAASVMVGTTAFLSLRTRVFPAWFAGFGFVVAGVALLSVWEVFGLAVLVWLGVASVVMLRWPRGLIALEQQPA
jgi:hypothetical protein